MEFDLNRWIEGLFSSLVEFAASVVTSVATIISRPRVATLRLLWSRYNAPKWRQVGPNTLLVLALIPVQYAVLSFTTTNHEDLTDAARQLIQNANSDLIWQTALRAVIVVALLDFFVRVLGPFDARGRFQRLLAKWAQTKYALAAPIAVGSLLWMLAISIPDILMALFHIGGYLQLAAMLFVLAVGLVLISRVQRLLLQGVIVAAACLILPICALGVSLIPSIFFDILTNPSEETYKAFTAQYRLSPLKYFCSVEQNGELRVSVVLMSQSWSPQYFYVGAKVTIDDGVSHEFIKDAPLVPISGAPRDGYVLLGARGILSIVYAPADEAGTAKLILEKAPHASTPSSYGCSVRASSSGSYWHAEGTVVNGRVKDPIDQQLDSYGDDYYR